MKGSERPKACSYSPLEDNHSEIITLHRWAGLFASLLRSVLMLASTHKAFISLHVSALLTWTWCTADLLPGTVFSDTSLAGMSQCILTDRFVEGWDSYTAVSFFLQQSLWRCSLCFASSYLPYVNVIHLPSVQAITDDCTHHRRFSWEHWHARPLILLLIRLI